MNKGTDIRMGGKWNASKWKSKYQSAFSSYEDWKSDAEYEDEFIEPCEKKNRKTRRENADWND
jgi:hypothetical protein